MLADFDPRQRTFTPEAIEESPSCRFAGESAIEHMKPVFYSSDEKNNMENATLRPNDESFAA